LTLLLQEAVSFITSRNFPGKKRGLCAGFESKSARLGGVMKRIQLLMGCAIGAALLNAQPAPADDLAPLCDEFDNAASLPNWQRVYQTEGWNANQLQTFNINTSQAGWMRMVPHASTWYQDYRGELTYKNVGGDFAITTRVRATNRAGTGAPNAQFSLAGIMVRTPRNITPATWAPGGENYVFLSLGAANNPGTYQFEVKTTTNSVSNLLTAAAPGNEADIQVARLGSSLIMLRRPSGGAWAVHQRYSRPDMPAQLQAGLTVYTDWPTASTYTPFNQNSTVILGGNPDLDARFDFVRYRRPIVPAALQGLNFSDPAQVSDAQLLSFLGDNADDAQTVQPGVISLSAATFLVSEGAGNLGVTLTRSGGSDGAVSVNLATSNGTATAGGDYTATNTTVQFANGETQKSVSIPILNDTLTEANETFSIALSNPTGGATLGATSSATATIQDNDGAPLPRLTINDVSINEGNAGTTNAVFTVTLSLASALPVSVNFATSNGTATAGTDYTATSGTLNIAPGSTSATISVPIIGDLLPEGDEILRVSLSVPVNATIGDDRGIGTIVNDDGALPLIFISDVTLREGDAGSGTLYFTVRLSRPVPGTVSVKFATADGTNNAATAGSDYTAATGSVSFAAGVVARPLTVMVHGDTLAEANEQFFVNLSSPSGATIADNQGVATILNDDAAALSVRGAAPVAEADASSDSIALHGAINADSFNVRVNGQSVAIEETKVSSNSVLLLLPLGSLKRGDAVQVSWSGAQSDTAQTVAR
jgi:hypothetical protein